MKLLLTFTGVLEGVIGLTLAIAPSLVASIFGTSLTDPGAILIGRLAGATLFTMAIACWLSRNDTHSPVVVKVMLVYNIFSIILLVYAALVKSIAGRVYGQPFYFRLDCWFGVCHPWGSLCRRSFDPSKIIRLFNPTGRLYSTRKRLNDVFKYNWPIVDMKRTGKNLSFES